MKGLASSSKKRPRHTERTENYGDEKPQNCCLNFFPVLPERQTDREVPEDLGARRASSFQESLAS